MLNHKTNTLLFGLFVVFANAPQVFASDSKTYAVDATKSPVTFLAVGRPGFLHISGEGGRLEGKVTVIDNQVSGTFDVKVTAFKTGMETRDRHMHEKYLESMKPEFETAQLKIKSMNLAALDGKKGEFDGDLTLKNVTQPVHGEFDATVTPDKGEITGQAQFNIKLTDYPIGVPSWLGVTVADEVQVSVNFQANQD